MQLYRDIEYADVIFDQGHFFTLQTFYRPEHLLLNVPNVEFVVMGLSIEFLISRKIKARPFANKKNISRFQEISPGEMSVN